MAIYYSFNFLEYFLAVEGIFFFFNLTRPKILKKFLEFMFHQPSVYVLVNECQNLVSLNREISWKP